jgi:hypothetical protein
MNAEHVALNEATFRQVNEAISPSGAGDRPFSVYCECPRFGCMEMLEVTPAEYERARSRPNWFLVFPGHEEQEVERAIERTERFVLVEKVGEAGEVAAEEDPRSE